MEASPSLRNILLVVFVFVLICAESAVARNRARGSNRANRANRGANRAARIAARAAGGATWNYTVQDTWGGQCGTGKKQSPIDIITKDAEETSHPALTWKNNATAFGTVTLKNSGHGFSVSGASMSKLILSGGGLPGEYELAQFHYHWSSDATGFEGAEHLVDGHRFASELHLVHFKTEHANLNAAVGSGKQDALAVVGILLDKSDRKAKGHEKILMTAIDDITKPDATTTADMSKVKINDLLPSNLKNFYRYEGSLTTPDCNEVVMWTVLEEDVTIAHELKEKFFTIEDAMGPLTYTGRSAMPLNGRKVQHNKESPEVHHNDGISFSQYPVKHIFTLVAISLAFLL